MTSYRAQPRWLCHGGGGETESDAVCNPLSRLDGFIRARLLPDCKVRSLLRVTTIKGSPRRSSLAFSGIGKSIDPTSNDRSGKSATAARLDIARRVALKSPFSAWPAIDRYALQSSCQSISFYRQIESCLRPRGHSMVCPSEAEYTEVLWSNLWI
jgi:hypothetical protein